MPFRNLTVRLLSVVILIFFILSVGLGGCAYGLTKLESDTFVHDLAWIMLMLSYPIVLGTILMIIMFILRIARNKGLEKIQQFLEQQNRTVFASRGVKFNLKSTTQRFGWDINVLPFIEVVVTRQRPEDGQDHTVIQNENNTEVIERENNFIEVELVDVQLNGYERVQ